MRVLVLGGTGNFGARIVRALCADPAIQLCVAARGATHAELPDGVPCTALTIESPDFAEGLRALSPNLVIHCVGPFQGQDYRVAAAALTAGAHYIDLADGRAFVAGFADSIHDKAVLAGRVAISGASTLPALSYAVVDSLQHGLSSLESIEVVIAPGQRASRGRATLEAVFQYLGRPFLGWRDGRRTTVWGWMDLHNVRLDIGRRLAAACDVPDLELFPSLFEGIQSVRFHAALEFRVQHWALWCLAAVRRMGLPLPVGKWAVGLNRLAGAFDAAGGKYGGMKVAIRGRRGDGVRVQRTWQLIAPAQKGPEVPCMAAVILARRLAAGEGFKPGAYPCIGFVALAEFAAEFAKWQMISRVTEDLL
jgi:NAD(P)-dependent dehydrogenase (short-subunit alcohol dehydrogenase family)